MLPPFASEHIHTKKNPFRIRRKWEFTTAGYVLLILFCYRKGINDFEQTPISAAPVASFLFLFFFLQVSPQEFLHLFSKTQQREIRIRCRRVRFSVERQVRINNRPGCEPSQEEREREKRSLMWIVRCLVFASLCKQSGKGLDWQIVCCMHVSQVPWWTGRPAFAVPFMTQANLPPAETLPQLFTDLYPHFPQIHLTPYSPPSSFL